MNTRVGRRLAVTAATAALAMGVAQAPANANAQWLIDGSSTDVNECAYASGQYSYSNYDVLGGLQAYSTTADLDVYETCPSGTAHLRMEYDTFNFISGTWYHQSWETVASSAGWSNYTDRKVVARNMHFRVCTYTSAGGNKNCGSVS